jgi:hypothetical protein
MRLGMDATRISDGRQVMLKMLPREEGPYELEINKLFSTEPLFSNPRNHCVHLLDVIELPNSPPIIVHPLLRPFSKPPFQTYGEFVTFFAQICEVSPNYTCSCPTELTICRRASNLCTRITSLIGMSSPFCSHFPLPIWPILVTARQGTSCLTHQICSLNLSTPLRYGEVRISVERPSGIRGRDVRRGTFSLILACRVDTTLQMGHHSINHCVVVTSRLRSTRIG